MHESTSRSRLFKTGNSSHADAKAQPLRSSQSNQLQLSLSQTKAQVNLGSNESAPQSSSANNNLKLASVTSGDGCIWTLSDEEASACKEQLKEAVIDGPSHSESLQQGRTD